jgi:hypothetical protein
VRDKRNGLGRQRIRAGVVLGGILALSPSFLLAQTCTTQARMTPDVRDGLSAAAFTLAQAVQGADVAKVQGMTIAEFSSASAFGPTENLMRSTASHMGNGELRVVQIYELDARSRAANDASDADFSCPLAGTTSETDFSISGLPRGLYGFAMVETTGDRPWLLSFLLRQDDGVWKLAGFYPRATTAAGHDGEWYWKNARTYAKADELWLAWIFYGQAAELLRPANFVTSTNLDRLFSERRTAAPPELAGGIGPSRPLVLKASDGKGGTVEYRFTGISAQASDDGKDLNLVLHVPADGVGGPAVGIDHSKAAAKAFLDAHMELRQAFAAVWIFAESEGREPLVTEQTISSIP